MILGRTDVAHSVAEQPLARRAELLRSGASAKIKDQLSLRIGANNIFDRDPPIAGGQVVAAAVRQRQYLPASL